MRHPSIALAIAPLLLSTSLLHAAEGPTFDCRKVAAHSIEATICQSPELSALDRALADVYQQASKKADNGLKAEQRGWIKRRNDCWKATDKNACIKAAYVQRTIELQAGYGLVPSSGPWDYECPKNDTITATFYQTQPASLLATYKGQRSLMVAAPAASGARYQGANESFWEHQGEALVQWGYDAAQMTCKRKS